MSKVIMQYPLDLSGEAQSNRVTHSIVLGNGSVNRAFAFPTGPFFVDTLRMTTASDPATPLTREVDFEAILIHPSLTKMAMGREVATALVVSNSKIPTDIVVTANIAGGPYGALVDSIQQCIDFLNLDDREVPFEELRHVPDVFAAAPAYKDMGDVFGMEYLVAAINNVNASIRVANSMELAQLQELLKQYRTELMAAIDEHRNAEGNVHNLQRNELDLLSADEIRQLIATVQKAIDDVIKDIGAINAKNGDQDQRLAALVSSLATLNQQLDAVNQNYQKSTLQLAEALDEIVALEKVIGLMRQELTAALNRITANEQAISQLRTDLAAQSGDFDNLERRIAALESGLATTNQTFNNHLAAASPHPQYLNRNTGGVVNGNTHFNANVTARDDVAADAGTK